MPANTAHNQCSSEGSAWSARRAQLKDSTQGLVIATFGGKSGVIAFSDRVEASVEAIGTGIEFTLWTLDALKNLVIHELLDQT